MKFIAWKRIFLIAFLVLLPAVSAWADIPCDGVPNLVYCQPWDQTGNAYSSQNDTTGGNGHFSTVYDNFKSNFFSPFVVGVYWVGEYFNPPAQGQITAWHIEFYNDNGGQPGGLAQAYTFTGNGNETFLGNTAGFPTYLYNEDVSFFADANTTYWIAVYPDLGFPPQWGWSSGTGGDGESYQDFFGVRTQLSVDMAFALEGSHICCGVPEPGTLVMVGTGVVSTGVLGTDVFGLSLLGLIGAIRRRLL